MKRVLLAAVLSALATALVLATIGFGAQSSKKSSKRGKQSQSQSQTQSGPPKTMKQVYDEMQTRRDAQDKKLAEALGVSVSDLRAAYDKLQQDRLDAQVKANQLTKQQAEAIVACKKAPLTCDRSNLPAGRPGGRHGRHDGDGRGSSTFTADLAKALGISEDKVKSALQSTRPAMPTGGGMPTSGGMPGRGGMHGHGGPGGPGGPGFGGPDGGYGGGPGVGDDTAATGPVGVGV